MEYSVILICIDSTAIHIGQHQQQETIKTTTLHQYIRNGLQQRQEEAEEETEEERIVVSNKCQTLCRAWTKKKRKTSTQFAEDNEPDKCLVEETRISKRLNKTVGKS